MPAKSKMAQISEDHGKPIEDVLAESFEIYGSQRQVAESLGVDQATIYTWLLKLGLKQKTILVKEESAS